MSLYLRILVGLVILHYSAIAFAQDSKELAPGYYIVVSAYAKSKQKMAQQYVEVLKGKGHNAEYGYNSSRKFYFVYLKYFDNLRESLRDMKKTREQGSFTDAWVRVVSGDIPSVADSDSSRPPGSSAIVTPTPNEIKPTDAVVEQDQAPEKFPSLIILKLYNTP